MSLGEEAQLELRKMLRDKNVFEMAKVLPKLPPRLLDAAVTQLKLQGNKFFKQKDYARAIECYTSCIAGAPNNAALYGNRSLCYLREKEYEKALADAEACMQLKPNWAKGYYRKGVVLMFTEKYDESVEYFRKANELQPNDQEIRRCLREAEGLEYNQRATLANTMGEPLPKAPIRRPEIPDPKFDPAMLARKIGPDDDWFKLSDEAKGLRVFMQNTDIVWNAPKRLVNFVDDPVATSAWDLAASKVIEEWEDPAEEDGMPVRVSALPSVLQLGTYLGFLTMICVDRGVSELQVMEPTPILLRKVRDVVMSNFSEDEAKLLLSEIRLAVNDPLRAQPGRDVPEKHDLLMVGGTAMNHDFWTSNPVEQIVHSKNHFLKPNHRIMPCRVLQHAAIIEWLDSEHTLGVDMSEATARYRWNVGTTLVDLDGQCYRKLTEEVVVGDFDLQNAALIRNFDKTVPMPVAEAGKAHGVVSWLTIYVTPDISFSNNPFEPLEKRSTFRSPLFQYFDPLPVTKGTDFPLTVHFNMSQLWFESQPRSSIIRSHTLPQWYFEMLHDEPRNRFFKQGIESIVSSWIKANPDREKCHVLDIGAGLGLLSVYAARANSKVHVYAAEQNKHLANTCGDICAANGVGDQVTVIKQDARHLTKKEVPIPADVLLFEVFDAGLIGEGILHFIEPIRNNVVTKNVTVMPIRGSVHAMLVQYRTEKLGKYDFSMMNSFRYQPDYFNMDVANNPLIIPMSDSFEVFSFDFQKQYKRQFSKVQPQQKLLDVDVTSEGIAGAVVFWWELQLTEEISISTSPFEEYSLHWKQAVQFIPEVKCAKGSNLALVGMHNTYGIQFMVHPDMNTLREGLEIIIKPPRIDQELERMHEELKKLQEDFYKAMQNERDFILVREAVTRLAVQPGAFQLNPEIVMRLVRSFYG